MWPSSRWLVLVRAFVTGVLAAVVLACAQGKSVVVANTEKLEVAAALECPVGSQGCACTAGGGCDPGLWCESGICVGSDQGGGYEYEFGEDLLEAEVLAPAPDPAPMRDVQSMGGVASKAPGRIRRAERHADRKLGKAAKQAPAPDAAPAETGVTAPPPTANVAPTPDEPRDPAEPIEHGEARQVIYTATMVLAVFDLDTTAELLESLPQRYGGWIESRYDYQITLRIRAERLFEVMDQLAEVGIVLDKSLLAEDVTAEYVDLESRIRVLEQIVAQLEALLAKAKTVEEALQIRVELDRMRIELEAARVRMRALSEQIDFSTLTVLLTPRGPDVLPSSNDPFPWVDQMGVEATEWR